MPQLPLDWANKIYNFAGVAGVIAAILVAAFAGLTMWSGRIRDQFADIRARASDERMLTANAKIADAESKIQQYAAKTAEALATAATANERAAKANLQLEHLKNSTDQQRKNLQDAVAQRSIMASQKRKLQKYFNGYRPYITQYDGSLPAASRFKRVADVSLFSIDDPENLTYRNEFADMFSACGLVVNATVGGVPGWQPDGTQTVGRPADIEIDYFDDRAHPIADWVADGLRQAGFSVLVRQSPFLSIEVGISVFIFGKKPFRN